MLIIPKNFGKYKLFLNLYRYNEIYMLSACFCTASSNTSIVWSQTCSKSVNPRRKISNAFASLLACILKCILFSAGWGTV